MAQTTFELKIEEILLTCYLPFEYRLKAIAETKAAVLAELPEKPRGRMLGDPPMKYMTEYYEGRLSVIKELTEKIK